MGCEEQLENRRGEGIFWMWRIFPAWSPKRVGSARCGGGQKQCQRQPKTTDQSPRNLHCTVKSLPVCCCLQFSPPIGHCVTSPLCDYKGPLPPPGPRPELHSTLSLILSPLSALSPDRPRRPALLNSARVTSSVSHGPRARSYLPADSRPFPTIVRIRYKRRRAAWPAWSVAT